MEKIVFNGEEFEVVDEMKKTQFNTPSDRKPFKRKDQVTFDLIALCLFGAFSWGVFVWGLISFMG